MKHCLALKNFAKYDQFLRHRYHIEVKDLRHLLLGVGSCLQKVYQIE
jgi:hypothetical protein